MSCRADTAVNDVKRAAVLELQCALHCAEQRTHALVTAERHNADAMLRLANAQSDSPLVCMHPPTLLKIYGV